MSHRPFALLAALAVVLLGVGVPGLSSASFTSQTVTGSAVAAASDWTPPSVSVVAVPLTVSGAVTVAAIAADGETGLAEVVLEARPVSGSWSTLCSRAAAPYSCTWDTTTVPGGGYELRARATDRAGYSSVSAVVGTTVLNTARVVLTDPGELVRGTVSLTATAYNTGQLKPNLSLEYRLAGAAGSWATVCSADASTTTTCAWDTTGKGMVSDLYDVRAVAVLGGTTYTDTITDVLVDNVAPTVTMTDPGTPLSGTRTFAATAGDQESGVARVVLEYATTTAGPWAPLCTVNEAPYTCRVDTIKLTDGSYAFRATATDYAGNTRTSAPVSPRMVNNTVASVSVEDPGAYLAGTVLLNANAASTNGVASVVIQRSSGTGYVDVCRDTAAPYTCSWETTTVPDGLYNLRAVLTDGKGSTLVSAPVTGRQVDNSPLRGADVQSVNRGVVAGRFETGDQIVLTYRGQLAPGSVLAGWTGAAQNVTVRLQDGKLVGLPGTEDVLDVLSATGAPVNLGTVHLQQNYAPNSKTITYSGSQMGAATGTTDGVVTTTVTITLGAPSLGAVATATSPAAMLWTPSTAAVNLTGIPCSAVPVTESGLADKDF